MSSFNDYLRDYLKEGPHKTVVEDATVSQLRDAEKRIADLESGLTQLAKLFHDMAEELIIARRDTEWRLKALEASVA